MAASQETGLKLLYFRKGKERIAALRREDNLVN
jgi:hypothetical protein